jgi:DNA-directed RNA polymerase subunit L
MLNTFVIDRIKQLPIKQDVSPTTIFSINITNNEETRIQKIKNRYSRVERDYGPLTDEEKKSRDSEINDAKFPSAIYVESGDITYVSSHNSSKSSEKKLPFNETFVLATLDPGQSLTCTNITITSSFGYKNACFSLVASAALVPLDQTPIDLYTNVGTSSSVSNPKEHRITFKTNGIMEPYDIILYAIESLSNRLLSVRELLEDIQRINDSYVLTIKDESHSIGNLLMYTILTNENVNSVVYNVEKFDRGVSIIIKSDNDVKQIFSRTIDHLTSLCESCSKYFK